MADVEIVIESPDPRVPPVIAIAMTVSQAEQDHQAMLRARSYERHVAAHHITRYPC